LFCYGDDDSTDQDNEDLITVFRHQCSSILWRNTTVESGAVTSATTTAREVSVNCSDRSSSDSIIDQSTSDSSRTGIDSSSSSGSGSGSNHNSVNSEETFTSLERLFAFAKPTTNAPIFDIISRLIDKLVLNGEVFNPEGYLVKEGRLTDAPTNTGGALLYLLLCRLKNEIEIEERKVGGTTEFKRRQDYYNDDKKYRNKDLEFFVISNYDGYNSIILNMLKDCLSEIYTHLCAFDNSDDGIATMTFEQMSAFEANSKVCII